MNNKSHQLENLSDRLNYILQITGTKKADLARSIDVKPQIIQFLCSSQTQSSRFTFEIAMALGLNTRWLATGEGEMFVADDPQQLFFKSYKKIPLLTIENLRSIFLHNKPLAEQSIETWLPLKTEDENVFAITMTDSSMEPYIPSGANVFIKRIIDLNISDFSYLFTYLTKFDTFTIREKIEINSKEFLVPKNMELFKEINFDNNVNVIGVVIGCFWSLRS